MIFSVLGNWFPLRESKAKWFCLRFLPGGKKTIFSETCVGKKSGFLGGGFLQFCNPVIPEGLGLSTSPRELLTPSSMRAMYVNGVVQLGTRPKFFCDLYFLFLRQVSGARGPAKWWLKRKIQKNRSPQTYNQEIGNHVKFDSPMLKKKGWKK